MIPAAHPAPKQATGRPDWKRLWREAVRDPRELLALVELGHLAAGISDAAAAQVGH